MLNDLKIMLGIESSDNSLDEKLTLVLNSVQGRLKLLLGGIEVPQEMNHIVIEVAVIRFNRLGSEGMSSHNVEGESMSYNDNDFDGFMNEIQAFFRFAKGIKARKGAIYLRCDTEVFLQSVMTGEYNESTGDYGDDIIYEEKRHASVTDTGTDTMNLVYGAIKQGSKTVRLQMHL